LDGFLRVFVLFILLSTLIYLAFISSLPYFYLFFIIFSSLFVA